MDNKKSSCGERKGKRRRERERGVGEKEKLKLRKREKEQGMEDMESRLPLELPPTLAWVSDLRQATKPLQTHYLPCMVGS